jgi:hypothetical protein
MWRRCYTRWRDATRERLDLQLLELMPPLAARCPSATVIDKTRYSAFAEPRLIEHLRQREADGVIVSGSETDVCVLAIVLDAVDIIYQVIVVRDAVCSSSDEGHDMLMRLYHRPICGADRDRRRCGYPRPVGVITPSLGSPTTSRQPDMHQRTVLAVHWVLAWACDPINCRKSLCAILLRLALIVGARSRIGADHQKIVARLDALMPRTCRKDGYVTRLEGDSVSVLSSKSHLTASPRDAKDFMGARMVMDIVVDAVPPRASPTSAIKQLFKYGRGVEALW